ncbi:tetratricopeptide repeat protein [Streptomyces iconiensis]|uniref:Tetratricopeptide repeat protein n=1 Tax=Streptomyces iconiensis TaxID=1384038 RepID=A0ABT7A4N9_9ACTN|nr:tetratricopeptide repeat protein [Streptomyces iconiensis]MDJ1136285.1 tetratricopeptide repeat protein [Streptomyces iconiensis]
MKRNSIGGSVRGPVVQAGVVHGGVHLYHQAPSPPPPRQLFPVTAAWTDREADLERLDAALGERSSYASATVVITGVGGVGKSALAARWLRAQEEHTPDGQLYADLGGGRGVRPGAVLRRFLRALGLTRIDGDLDEVTSLWRSVTAGRRLALLLDNAADAALVRPLLPGGQGHLIAVTARRPLTDLVAEGARIHRLEPLAEAAATQLLARLVGEERVARERAALEELAGRCGHLPLALCVAASRLVALPDVSVATVAAHARTDHRIDVGTPSVTTTVHTTYQELPHRTARVYRLLGALPHIVIDVGTTAAACALAPEEAAWQLRALADVRLLESQGEHPGGGACFRLHDEVRPHAKRCVAEDENEASMTEAARRWLDWLLLTFTRAENLLTPAHQPMDRDVEYPSSQPFPFDDEEGAMRWLESHQSDLEAGVRAAETRGWDSLVWQLVHSAWPLFHRTRPLELWLDLHYRGLTAAGRCRHRGAQREMLTTLAIGLRGAGRYTEAAERASDALRLAREDGDARCEAQALHELGVCHHAQHEGQLASAVLEEAITIRERLGYRRGVGLSHLTLGLVHLEAGRAGQAIGHLTFARTELSQVPDVFDTARATAWLGRAWARGGDFEKATGLLEEALGEFRALRSARWQARALHMLGCTAEEQHQPERAQQLFTQALEIASTVSPKDAEHIREGLRRITPHKPGQQTEGTSPPTSPEGETW